jgi:outer membrane protein TolC
LGGSFGNSFSDYSNRKKADYSLGIVADISLGGQQERANLNEALLRLRQAELEVKRTANRVASQVQTAYARVDSAMQRATASSRAVETAQAALGAEEKRLTNGLTTSFNVLKLQDEVSQARINRLEAIAEGHKAVVVLWGVVGVLLDRYQIDAVGAPHVMTRP